MEKLKITGGAKIGALNASWPLAKLYVSKDVLQLQAGVIGQLTFSPQDIVAIEPHVTIPLVGQGLRIYHNIESYAQNIVFWTFKSPQKVIAQIRDTGFMDEKRGRLSDEQLALMHSQASGGFPIKMTAAAVIIIFWNTLIITDVLRYVSGGAVGRPLGYGAVMALAMLFGLSLLTLLNKNFSRLILKKENTVDDIRVFLYSIMVISGLILLGLLFFWGINRGFG